MINDLINPGTLFLLVSDLDIFELFQVYLGSPQFLGFFLEQTDFGLRLNWGQTLLSSLLYPVPILGKLFRPTSGYLLYNLIIYGVPGMTDQVVPFQGELFLDFHIVGIGLGYFLLGYIIAKLQSAFDRAHNSFEAFSFSYMAIWMLFLIVGSLAVTSQIYLYFLWPIYFYFLLKFVSSRIHHGINCRAGVWKNII